MLPPYLFICLTVSGGVVIGEELAAIWNSRTHQNLEVNFHIIIYESTKD